LLNTTVDCALPTRPINNFSPHVPCPLECLFPLFPLPLASRKILLVARTVRKPSVAPFFPFARFIFLDIFTREMYERLRIRPLFDFAVHTTGAALDFFQTNLPSSVCENFFHLAFKKFHFITAISPQDPLFFVSPSPHSSPRRCVPPPTPFPSFPPPPPPSHYFFFCGTYGCFEDPESVPWFSRIRFFLLYPVPSSRKSLSLPHPLLFVVEGRAPHIKMAIFILSTFSSHHFPLPFCYPPPARLP